MWKAFPCHDVTMAGGQSLTYRLDMPLPRNPPCHTLRSSCGWGWGRPLLALPSHCHMQPSCPRQTTTSPVIKYVIQCYGYDDRTPSLMNLSTTTNSLLLEAAQTLLVVVQYISRNIWYQGHKSSKRQNIGNHQAHVWQSVSVRTISWALQCGVQRSHPIAN